MRASHHQILLHACGTDVLTILHEKQKLSDLFLRNSLYRVATLSRSSSLLPKALVSEHPPVHVFPFL